MLDKKFDQLFDSDNYNILLILTSLEELRCDQT